MNNKSHDKYVLSLMIACYCKAHHGSTTLCAECQALLVYATERIEHCSLEEEKISCKLCPIHCYHTEEKKAIRRVMRYAGPRMLLSHPIIAIKHLIKEKIKR